MHQLFRARGYGFEGKRWTQTVEGCRVVVGQIAAHDREWMDTAITGEQPDERVQAIFMIHDSVKQSNKQPLIEAIEENQLTRVLVVTDNISALVQQQIQELDCQVEQWKPIDCFTGAAQHFSAPKMSHSQRQIPVSHRFTRCRLSDPLARFYGFREGDVVKIHRRTHVGLNIEHRIVEKEKIKVKR